MVFEELYQLEEYLGYTFSDKSLLQMALTHPSVCSEDPNLIHNQRLEFLGDSILGATLSKWLYGKYPTNNEGELSKKKAILARGSNLAEIGKSLNLEKFIFAARSEKNKDGCYRASLIEDVLESVIGAIVLDSDFDAAQKVILSWVEQFEKTLKKDHFKFNPKGRLQEILQANSKTCRISYKILKESGPDHQKEFSIEVHHNGKPLAKAHGSSKRQAEEKAASIAINLINKE